MAIRIFGNKNDAQKQLNEAIRNKAFEIAIKNNIDMIFTYVTAFDREDNINYLKNLQNMFEQTGGTFYLVELQADIETRMKRNITPHRLESKPSKQNIEWSKNEIVKTMQEHRLNSNEDEFFCDNHIKIDNTNLSPDEVSEIIIDKYKLSSNKIKK